MAFSSECLFYLSAEGCKFGEKCSHAHRQVEEQFSKWFERNSDRSAVALLKETKNLGCVFSGHGAAEFFIDFKEELKHDETNPMCSLHHGRIAQCQRTEPKSIAQQNLPRGFPSK